MRDLRGCAVSGSSPRALDLYEQALEGLWLQRGDALRLARQASAAAPTFAAAHLLEATLLVASRDVREHEAAGWVFARLRGLGLNRREAMHARALATAIDGDFARASRLYDQILEEEPCDALALWVAQVMDYYLGNPQALRDRAGRALSGWSASMPGFHAVLSTYAFGLEECGEYAAAEQTALRALELEPRDVRAEHALLHVLEMQGRAFEGLRWMARRAGRGAAEVSHLSWHQALFYLQLDCKPQALAVYDRSLRLDNLSDLIDASALLWRLALAGADIGERFAPLAARWAPHAEDAYCAFNDLHAMMAFAGAQRWSGAAQLLAAQERRMALTSGSNHDMTRLVGYPACQAVAAFGRGEYQVAERLLRSLPPVAHRIGGSHAQRDVLTLTRAAAARFQIEPPAAALPEAVRPGRGRGSAALRSALPAAGVSP